MKTMLLFALIMVLSAVSVSGSAKDRILEMYSYDEPTRDGTEMEVKQTATVITTQKTIESVTGVDAIFTARYYLLSSRDERSLEEKLRPKQQKVSSFDFERIKIMSRVKEDSMLYNMAEGVVSMHDTYRKIRGGIEADMWGQPLTLYLHQRIVWKIGKYETLELVYSGRKRLEYSWKF